MSDVAAQLGVLTPEDVAPALGCTPKTVEDELRAGLLPGWKSGRGWRLSADALRQALAARSMANMPAPAPAQPSTLRGRPGHVA